MSPTYLGASTFAGDAVFIAPRRSLCEAAARFGMPAYCYRFDAVPNSQQAPTHFHKISFVFDNTNGQGYHLPIHPLPFTGKPESYFKLAKFISHSWVSFIVDHNPNTWRRRGQWDGLEPEWPLYDKENAYNFVLEPGASYFEPDTFWKEQV